MIATVTKRFVSVPTLFKTEQVTLTEGTELDLHPVTEDGERKVYLGSIVSGYAVSRQPVKFTEQQAANWLVFRSAYDLGY